MNPREIQQVEFAERSNLHHASTRSEAHTPSNWLANYPIFRDALHHGETSFGKLPRQAKLVAIRRTTSEVAETAFISTAFDEVGASFVELHTEVVEAAVQHFLASQQNNVAARLDEISLQDAGIQHPFVARQPCLLSPRNGIFLDSWMRFFAYRSRKDKTIPLLAVDWPAFYERLSQGGDSPGSNAT
jgi:hypothetical protein